MYRKNILALAIAVTMSSPALALDNWGDNTLGPQPLVPPAVITFASTGRSIYMPPIGPQPTVPPADMFIVISGTSGGFLPWQPGGPLQPIEELPMIAASADLDEQLDGFDKGHTDLTMRELGEMIDTLYEVDSKLHTFTPENPLSPQGLVLYLVSIIKIAGEHGHVEATTVQEIEEMTASWYE